MQKNNFMGSLIIFTFAMTPFVYAGKVELTTYYPAPTGEYQELATNRLKIGPNAQMPATDNVVNFDGSESDPAPSTGSNHDGDLYYNTAADGDHKFRYYDASAGSGAWKDLGGGGSKIYTFEDGTDVYNASPDWVDIPGMQISRNDFPEGEIFIYAEVPTIICSYWLPGFNIRITIDGSSQSTSWQRGNIPFVSSLHYAGPISQGSHTIRVQWQSTGGTNVGSPGDNDWCCPAPCQARPLPADTKRRLTVMVFPK